MVADYIGNTRRTRNGYPRSGYKYNRRSRTDRHRQATAISAKTVKNDTSATENNKLEDLCQNTQNEIQTHQDFHTIPKSDTQLMVSLQYVANKIEEPESLVMDIQEITESGPAMEIDKQATNETNLVWSEEDFFDITVVPVSYEED
ncbi:30812_t:CDS:2 [Gigaspora margarita]|uniref:30812_t:CDS:1 n=1 Tax=Gigaspora margarita TaxID=4874 RepID=A0ABN7V965_GIGMA|nr:30812_t:CDS:2 [Gigaspora margarita]